MSIHTVKAAAKAFIRPTRAYPFDVLDKVKAPPVIPPMYTRPSRKFLIGVTGLAATVSIGLAVFPNPEFLRPLQEFMTQIVMNYTKGEGVRPSPLLTMGRERMLRKEAEDDRREYGQRVMVSSAQRQMARHQELLAVVQAQQGKEGASSSSTTSSSSSQTKTPS